MREREREEKRQSDRVLRKFVPRLFGMAKFDTLLRIVLAKPPLPGARRGRECLLTVFRLWLLAEF